VERVALVAMLVVCERPGYRLNQGLANIFDVVFSKWLKTTSSKKKLFVEFRKKLFERPKDDIEMAILEQLGQ
jgi:hypothetical protein